MTHTVVNPLIFQHDVETSTKKYMVVVVVLPRNLTWNLKMMVSKFGISFSRYFFSGSMLNFRGVSVYCVFLIPCLLQFKHQILAWSPSQLGVWPSSMEYDGIYFISSGRELKRVYDMV